MPKRILLADDSAAARKSVESALDSSEYQLLVAEDGRSAMELLERKRPHMVLAHAMLPEMDGYELCASLKDKPESSHIPVMLLTGTFEPFDINRAKDVRYDGFITKPVDERELQRSISAAIEAAVYPAGYDDEPADAEPAEPETVAEAEEAPGATLDAVSDVPEPVAQAEGGSEAMLDKIFPEEEEPLGDFLSDTVEETISVSDGTEEDIFSIVEPMPEEPAETVTDSDDAERPVTEIDPWGKSAEEEPEPVAVVEEEPAETAVPEDDASGEVKSTEDDPASGEGNDLSWFLSKYEDKAGGETLTADPVPADDDAVGAFVSPVLETTAPEEAPAAESSPFFEDSPEQKAPDHSEPEAAEPLEPLPEDQAAGDPDLTVPVEEAPPVSTVLEDDQLERIARRVVELLTEDVVRNVAWEAVPEIAERLIRERIREIEAEAAS